MKINLEFSLVDSEVIIIKLNLRERIFVRFEQLSAFGKKFFKSRFAKLFFLKCEFSLTTVRILQIFSLNLLKFDAQQLIYEPTTISEASFVRIDPSPKCGQAKCTFTYVLTNKLCILNLVSKSYSTYMKVSWSFLPKSFLRSFVPKELSSNFRRSDFFIYTFQIVFYGIFVR